MGAFQVDHVMHYYMRASESGLDALDLSSVALGPLAS